MLGHPCDRPLQVCLAIAPIPGVFDNSPEGRVISRAEAYELLKETETQGLVHMTSNIQNGSYYVCNCCKCCCGVLGAINKLGLKVIARVDNQPEWATAKKYGVASAPPDNPQDYADFIGQLAARYGPGSSYGRIHAYEVWNEPNLSREWGGMAPNAAEYVALLKAAYGAVKKADPEALVITAGLSPTTAPPPIAVPDVDYLKQMYAAGAKAYFDVLGAHGAGFKAPPELSPDDAAKDPQYNHGEGEKGRVYCFRHVEDLRAVMAANGDSAKKVAVLEFGWTTDSRPDSPYAWHAVTPAEQADYLVRAFGYAKEHWSSWVGPMIVIYIADPLMTKDTEQYYWAVTNPDGTPRPAYEALKAMPKK